MGTRVITSEKKEGLPDQRAVIFVFQETRKVMKVTQAELGKQLGCSGTNISFIERGKYLPNKTLWMLLMKEPEAQRQLERWRTMQQQAEEEREARQKREEEERVKAEAKKQTAESNKDQVLALIENLRRSFAKNAELSGRLDKIEISQKWIIVALKSLLEELGVELPNVDDLEEETLNDLLSNPV